jgi:endonuclease/exonuclease/phosphatase family metal-dependent hydrolase
MLDSMRERIAETGADIVFLQEIHGTAIKSQSKRRRFSYPDQPHFEYLANEAWPHYAYGRNAIYRKGDHGNAILSMYPFVSWENIDISIFPRTSRSILHGVIELPNQNTRHADLGLRELFMQMRGRHALTFPVRRPLLPVDRIYYRGLQPSECQRLNTGHWRDLSDHAALFGVFHV